jgi:putative ABC transport system substrate-binding protein
VNVLFDRQFTEGDPARAEAAARKFNDDKVNLVFSVGTLTTQAVLKVTPRIPVVFAAVTDPVAAGIVPADSATGKTTRTNTTGISDGMATHRAMEVYARIVPSAKTWGTVFNPNEVNSVVEVKAVREAASRLGLRLIEVPVTSSGEVLPAVASLAGRVQALVLLHDNTVRPLTAEIAAVCKKRRLPLFGGIGDATSLASYNVNYYLVGYAAGKKAALVLNGLAPGSIPWESSGGFRLALNKKIAQSLGITFPADLLRIADKVID